MRIRTLLVDDEALARQALRSRLERTNDIVTVGECESGVEAIKAIELLQPDLVFLDVEMPELSGFDVVRSLDSLKRPYVIFVTAFDQYAAQAFEVQALDYLLKPIQDRRFEAVLRRARVTMSGTSEGASSCEAPNPSRDSPGSVSGAGPDRLAIPTGDRLVIVRISDIDWVEASGNYVSIHVERNTWLVRESLSALEQRLAPHGFARIHRSTLVNFDRVLELRSVGSGDFGVLLRDGTVLKLSRSYRPVLDALVEGVVESHADRIG